MKVIKRIKKYINDYLFNVTMKFVTKRISKVENNPFSYPLLVSLEFERDWYYDRYTDKNISIHESVSKKADMIQRKILRNLKERPDEFYRRYARFCRFYKEKKELDDLFELGNRIIDEHEGKQ